MSDTREKANAIFLSALMVLSVFSAAVAFTGSAGAAVQDDSKSGGVGALATTNSTEFSVNPATVTERETVTQTHEITLIDIGGDSVNDTVNVTLPNSAAAGVDPTTLSFAGSNVSTAAFSNIGVVQGNDGDGVGDTLQFDLEDTGTARDVAIDITFDVTAPPVASDTTVTPLLTVTDNGSGFTNASMASFLVRDSTAPEPVVTDNTIDQLVTQNQFTQVANVSFEQPGNVSTVSYDLAGPNSNNLTDDDFSNVTVRLINGSGVTLAEQSATGTGATVAGSFSFSPQVTNVAAVEILVGISSGAEQNDAVDANFTLTAASGDTFPVSGEFDTQGTQTVKTGLNAFLRGEVEFTDGTPADNVTIGVLNTDTGIIVDRVQTRGFDTTSPGTWGPEKYGLGNYTAVLIEPPGVDRFADFSTRVFLERDETETIFTTLERREFPVRIEVVPPSQVEFVGQYITYTATVFNQTGGVMDGVTVEVNETGGTAPFIDDDRDGLADAEPVTKVTDSNGEITINVTSNQVGTEQFTFRAINASGGTDPIDRATGTFIINGRGTIEGEVYDESTTEGLEDARVWTVLDSQYETNRRYTRVDLAPGGVGLDDDPYLWVRLVDNETGEIIDNDDYDVRNEEYNLTGVQDPNADTGIRLIEELNTSDAAEGEGFVVVDQDGDGLVAWNHTRIAPEDYYVQVSLDAWNASDEQTNDNDPDDGDSEEERFVNVTTGDVTFLNGSGSAVVRRTQITEVDPTTLGGLDPAVFEPRGNLTLDRTIQLANLAESNLVDAPGYVNTYGIDSGGTDAEGQFHLSQLFSDFQAGRGYVIIAAKPGYSTDFADVFVEEDGDFQIGVDSNDDEALTLQPEDIEPARVNILQVGLRPNASSSSASTANFTDQTDPTFQEIPRDGRTVDVVRVTTLTEGGAPVEANATVEVEDNDFSIGFDNLTGRFVRAENGTIVERSGEDQVTVNTGSDGVAFLLYQADSDATTFNTRMTAVLENDRSATDFSNKSFVGVINFRRASISGKVTDTNDDALPESAVWARRFEFPDRTGPDFAVRINPTVPTGVVPGTEAYSNQVDEFSDTFTVTLLRDTNITRPGLEFQDQTTVTARELQNFTFGSFDQVSTPVGAEFKLFDFAADSDASYTLDPVPAVEDPLETTDYRIRSVKLDRPEIGRQSNDGLAEVLPLTTDDANVVIPIDVRPADLEVTGLTAPSSVDRGNPIDVTATIENTGGSVGDTQTVEFRVDTDGDGSIADESAVASQNVTVTSGSTATVTFSDIPTAGLPTGTLTHGVATEDDIRTATITVNGSSASGVDVNGNGNLSTNVDTDPEHEDVTGDGVFTSADVTALFNDLSSSSPDATGNPDLFDFDGDSSVTTADVVALFNQLTAS